MEDKQNKQFTSIDVEKLNIVEEDGTIKMSLFNSQNMPPVLLEGEDILPGHRQDDNDSGIMFYNGDGFECGGLIFGSKKLENGQYESSLSLTFDQYQQDQVVQMFAVEQDGEQSYGFNFFDRPQETLKETIKKIAKIEKTKDRNERDELIEEIRAENPRRMFMGKKATGEIAIQMHDSVGNERIRIAIDKDDNPKIEFLNSEGEVIYSLPPEK